MTEVCRKHGWERPVGAPSLMCPECLADRLANTTPLTSGADNEPQTRCARCNGFETQNSRLRAALSAATARAEAAEAERDALKVECDGWRTMPPVPRIGVPCPSPRKSEAAWIVECDAAVEECAALVEQILDAHDADSPRCREMGACECFGYGTLERIIAAFRGALAPAAQVATPDPARLAPAPDANSVQTPDDPKDRK